MDELHLIRRVLDGQSNAYRILMVRYQRPIFRLLGTFNLPDAVVEEIAQEAFLRAYRSLPSYDPGRGASFSTWLFTIAKNLAINEVARASTRREVGGAPDARAGAVREARGVGATREAREIEIEAEARPRSESVAVGPSQHEALERAERRSMLHQALDALPRVFRTAVALAYLKELSLEEIAAIERCSVGTVKSRIFRGKRLLATALAKTEG